MKRTEEPLPLGADSTLRGEEANFLIDIIFVRTIFAVILMVAAYFISPFGLIGVNAALLGLASALGIIFFRTPCETRFTEAFDRSSCRLDPRHHRCESDQQFAY